MKLPATHHLIHMKSKTRRNAHSGLTIFAIAGWTSELNILYLILILAPKPQSKINKDLLQIQLNNPIPVGRKLLDLQF